MADRNPLFYQISTVYPLQGTVVIIHQYDQSFACILTLTELATAAGKFGNQYLDTTYLRLWDEAKNCLIRYGYVPVCEGAKVELRKTEGRIKREQRS